MRRTECSHFAYQSCCAKHVFTRTVHDSVARSVFQRSLSGRQHVRQLVEVADNPVNVEAGS